MNARKSLWSFIDRLCPAADPSPFGGAQSIPLDERRSAQLEAGVQAFRDPPILAAYPQVTIWRKGEAVAFGDLVQVSIYPSRMSRIMYRHFREGRYSATFYWADGAWASVCFPDAAAMNDLLRGTAAGLLQWPEPEVI